MKFIDKKVRLSFIIVKFKNNSMKYIFRYHPMLMSDPLNDLGCLLTEKIDIIIDIFIDIKKFIDRTQNSSAKVTE